MTITKTLLGSTAGLVAAFGTLPVKTTPGIGGPGTLDSGLGCSQQCVTKALVTQNPPDGTAARNDIRTVDDVAHPDRRVARQAGAARRGGLAQYEVVSRRWTPSPRTDWAPLVAGLDYGRKYYVVVRARAR